MNEDRLTLSAEAFCELCGEPICSEVLSCDGKDVHVLCHQNQGCDSPECRETARSDAAIDAADSARKGE